MAMPATKASPDGPAGLAFDRAGDLFIFGLNTKALLVLDTRGSSTLSWEPAGDGFFPHSPGGIVTAPDGHVLGLDGTSLDEVTSSAVRPLVNFATNEVTRAWKASCPMVWPSRLTATCTSILTVPTGTPRSPELSRSPTRIVGVPCSGKVDRALNTFLDSSAGQSVEVHLEGSLLTPP